MAKEPKSLMEAVKIALPKMAKNEKALDAISDMISNYLFEDYDDNRSKIVESFDAKFFEEFTIDIHEFHGIFWITAPEFDDEGYFTNLKDAIAFAKKRYGEYIENA